MQVKAIFIKFLLIIIQNQTIYPIDLKMQENKISQEDITQNKNNKSLPAKVQVQNIQPVNQQKQVIQQIKNIIIEQKSIQTKDKFDTKQEDKQQKKCKQDKSKGVQQSQHIQDEQRQSFQGQIQVTSVNCQQNIYIQQKEISENQKNEEHMKIRQEMLEQNQYINQTLDDEQSKSKSKNQIQIANKQQQKLIQNSFEQTKKQTKIVNKQNAEADSQQEQSSLQKQHGQKQVVNQDQENTFNNIEPLQNDLQQIDEPSVIDHVNQVDQVDQIDKQHVNIQEPKAQQQQEAMSPTNVRKKTTAIQSQKKSKNQNYMQMLKQQIVCIEDMELKVVIHMGKKVQITGKFIVTSYRILFLQEKQIKIQQQQTMLQPQSQTLENLGIQDNPNTNDIVQQQKQNQIKLQYQQKKQEYTKIFVFPIGYIAKCQRNLDQSTGLSHLQLTLKTGLNIKLKYLPNKYSSSSKANQIILNLINKNIFVALDEGKYQKEDNLCQKYQPNFDIDKLEGAYYYDNFQWNQMISYPEKFVVPLPYIGKRKTQYRLVVLSSIYKLKQEKIGLWRTGPGLPDPSEDQWVPKAKHTKKHLAIQIKNKGIGTSKSLAARTIELQNLSLLRDSFQKMHSLSYHGNDSTKWMSSVANSKWYEQITMLIQQTFVVIDLVTEGTHVTLLSDTQSRGAQIAALVQLLLNTEYRTLNGFGKLIQKQFLHYGVQKPTKKQKQEDKGIILIQFLDCVYQLCQIYPLSFEFNHNFLVFIAEHVYSGKYGNFLYIAKSIKETKKSQILRCACIWKDLKQKIESSQQIFFCPEKSQLGKKQEDYYNYFRNCFYIDPKESDIIELRSHVQISKCVKVWGQYFNKKHYCSQSLQEEIWHPIEQRYQKIRTQYSKMKKQNEILKKKLSDQHKSIVEQKSIIKKMSDI